MDQSASLFIFQFLFDLLGWGEFLPSSWWLDLLAETVCDSAFEPLCQSIIFLLCGFDDAQMNDKLLPTILSHTPAGASTKQVGTIMAIVNNGMHQKIGTLS